MTEIHSSDRCRVAIDIADKTAMIGATRTAVRILLAMAMVKCTVHPNFVKIYNLRLKILFYTNYC